MWAQVALSYENGIHEFTLKAPNKDWKVTAEYSSGGEEKRSKLDVNIDGKELHYISTTKWTEGKISGQSKFTNTFPQINMANSESRYDISYPTDFPNFNRPLKIEIFEKYEKVSMLLKMNLNYESKSGQSAKITFDGSLSMPDVFPKDISVEFLANTDMKSNIVIKGKFNGNSVNMKLEKKDNHARYKIEIKLHLETTYKNPFL